MKYGFIAFENQPGYRAKLIAGLAVLGSAFSAKLCWWCDGLTYRNYDHCDICGKDGYGTAKGLLIENDPAPASVVNQVLVAAERAKQ